MVSWEVQSNYKSQILFFPPPSKWRHGTCHACHTLDTPLVQNAVMTRAAEPELGIVPGAGAQFEI